MRFEASRMTSGGKENSMKNQVVVGHIALIQRSKKQWFTIELLKKLRAEGYMEELEGVEYIKKVEPDAGISGYILTTKGNDELKKKGEISFVKELNIQPQIGLINIQNSVSGSVF